MVAGRALLGFIAIWLLATAPANATLLGITFDDFTGDNAGAFPTDLLSVRFQFETTTGDYSVTFNTTVANPFTTGITYNFDLSLGNNSDGTSSDLDFTTGIVMASFLAPTTTHVITGNDFAELSTWSAGDVIITASAIGLFDSAIADSADPVNEHDLLQRSGTLVTVPEPATLSILGSGLLLLGFLRGRRRSSSVDP